MLTLGVFPWLAPLEVEAAAQSGPSQVEAEAQAGPSPYDDGILPQTVQLEIPLLAVVAQASPLA